jgi:hypothetical protein
MNDNHNKVKQWLIGLQSLHYLFLNAYTQQFYFYEFIPYLSILCIEFTKCMHLHVTYFNLSPSDYIEEGNIADSFQIFK